VTEAWRPAAPLANLHWRARALKTVRGFLDDRGYTEVETPVLAAAGVTDPNLQGLTVSYHGPDAASDGQLWLQTSPEYAMKRLLAAGSGPIYQIARAFRGGEHGRLHNPEFSLLEWYRLDADHWAKMAEVARLVATVLGERPAAYRRYAEVFAEYLGVDPLTADNATLANLAEERIDRPPGGLDRDGLLDLLMGQVVVPRLGRSEFTFVTDFPASQAALARLNPADPRVAERFECYVDGVELANGFHELTDAAEQARRFAADTQYRQARGEPIPAVDEHLLAALRAGLPPCTGTALGLDRLFMLALGESSLDAVMAFPLNRA